MHSEGDWMLSRLLYLVLPEACSRSAGLLALPLSLLVSTAMGGGTTLSRCVWSDDTWPHAEDNIAVIFKDTRPCLTFTGRSALTFAQTSHGQNCTQLNIY